MSFSSFGFRGKSFRCAAAIVAAVSLAGCSEDPGLQERLNRLQAEMQEKDRQLQEAQSTLEKTRSELKSARASGGATKPAPADPPSSTPGATPQFLSKEQVEESYAAASKAMQKRVGSELRNYSVENCTQFPVAMPSDEYPYHSKVALSIRSDSGHSYRLEFPVSADVTGKWTFPTSVDIAGALADSRQQDQNTSTAGNPPSASTAAPKVAQYNATPAPTSRPSMQTNPQMVPGQAATETRVIDWGGSHSPSSSRPGQTPVPASSVTPVQPTPPVREVQQPTPQGSRAPAQTMQADKDVTIHW